ncbi:Outer membrane efflux protein [Candidatus Sulfopaludibacter sp. SbA3]|nr:Outer membrane efflux protein [Candidatus Sulfopaludibacter sp. SbA3]
MRAFWALLLVFSGAAKPIQLKEFIATALARNPEILAAQKRYEAARLRPAQENSLPDPRLSFGYASNGGPLPGQGLGSQPTSNIGVMVSQEIPYPGKLKLRGGIAAKEAGAEFQQYLAVQLSVRSRVIQAYHMLHHTYAMVEILNQGKDLVSRTIGVSEVRYSAGKAAQQDILKAQTQLSLLETRIIQMLQDRRSAEAELNALLNRQPGSPVGVPEDADPPALPLTVEELLARAAETAPDLGRGRKMIERGELAVNLARKEFHPDYTVSAGYYNMGAMPSMYEARIEIPLHLHTAARQRPALDEQVQLLGEARHNFEAAEQNLQFRVREAYAAAQTAFRLMKIYSDTILPQSSLTIESSLASYETGATDFLSVLTNVITRIDAQQQAHEQELNYALALAKLEELTGVSLEAKP